MIEVRMDFERGKKGELSRSHEKGIALGLFWGNGLFSKKGTFIEAQVATFRARRIDRVPFQKKEEYWDNRKDNRAVALEDALISVRIGVISENIVLEKDIL